LTERRVTTPPKGARLGVLQGDGLALGVGLGHLQAGVGHLDVRPGPVAFGRALLPGHLGRLGLRLGLRPGGPGGLHLVELFLEDLLGNRLVAFQFLEACVRLLPVVVIGLGGLDAGFRLPYLGRGEGDCGLGSQ
jgi:hypothetical protein